MQKLYSLTCLTYFYKKYGEIIDFDKILNTVNTCTFDEIIDYSKKIITGKKVLPLKSIQTALKAICPTVRKFWIS